MDEVGLLVVVGAEDDVEAGAAEDLETLGRVLLDLGRVEDGAVEPANVQVEALVLVQLDHVLVILQLKVLVLLILNEKKETCIKISYLYFFFSFFTSKNLVEIFLEMIWVRM